MKIIEINSPKYGHFEVKVDDEDYEHFNQWKWSVSKNGNTFYASREIREDGKKRKSLIHREILNLINSKILTDHIDHNGLNNQRENLRLCNTSQNAGNRRIDSLQTMNSSSKFKGVYWDNSRNQCWRSAIRVNGKRHHLGSFDSEIDAAKAYNEAAIKYFGEFACLNIIEGINI